ncbi:MAG: enoyl-CoA hydratase/isomerase family protein [Deferribacterales bacterium]
MVEIIQEVDEIYKIVMTPEENFNILNPETIKSLIDAFEKISKTEAKIIRIYGEGGSFAVGANIKQMLEYDGYEAKGFSILGNKLFKLMSDIPQIIIAEIDGFCMGGGVDFASAADFRFATYNSKFAHPGSILGIITGFGGTQRLPRLMKQSSIYKMFILGERFDAKFMYESRFLYKLFDSYDEMSSFSLNLAQKIAKKNKLFINDLKKHKYWSH